MSQLTGVQAAIGLSFTFSKLEEVQTERRGEGKNQKKKKKITKKQQQKNPTPQTKNKIHSQKMYTQLGLALGQKGRRKKGHKALKFSPQNTAGCFYQIRWMKKTMLTVEVVCVRVQPSHPFKAP